MKRPIPLSLAAVLLAAGSLTAAVPALADDDRRDRRGWQSDRDHRGDRNDRRDWRDDDRRASRGDWRRDDRDYRYDRRDRRDRYDQRRVAYRPVVVHHRPVVYHPRPVVRYAPPRYAAGYHYGHRGYGPSYVVNDYRGYGLHHPPRGYGWRRSDAGDFLLVALATGIIAEVIFGH